MELVSDSQSHKQFNAKNAQVIARHHSGKWHIADIIECRYNKIRIRFPGEKSGSEDFINLSSDRLTKHTVASLRSYRLRVSFFFIL